MEKSCNYVNKLKRNTVDHFNILYEKFFSKLGRVMHSLSCKRVGLNENLQIIS